MAKINVKDVEVTVIQINSEDYICITDMIKAKDGEFFVSDWLRNRNTLEYIGIWEQIHNPCFNYTEFAIIKSKAGLNSFKISVKELIEKTNLISRQAKAGRYGGTVSHKIALEKAEKEYEKYRQKTVSELSKAEQDFLENIKHTQKKLEQKTKEKDNKRL